MISVEEWKAVPGWRGYFEISSHGRAKRLAKTVMRACDVIKGRSYV